MKVCVMKLVAIPAEIITGTDVARRQAFVTQDVDCG
jgi:hypothetical protein